MTYCDACGQLHSFYDLEFELCFCISCEMRMQLCEIEGMLFVWSNTAL